MPESVQIRSIEDAVNFLGKVNKPIMIKPANSSGSKGVGKATFMMAFMIDWHMGIYLITDSGGLIFLWRRETK